MSPPERSISPTPCVPCAIAGKYMQEAVPVGEGAMAAILGMTFDVLRGSATSPQGQVCQAANIISPLPDCDSGSKAAVERAAELAKQKGAKRAVILPQ